MLERGHDSVVIGRPQTGRGQGDTPAAFAEFVKTAIANWTCQIKAAGIQPE